MKRTGLRILLACALAACAGCSSDPGKVLGRYAAPFYGDPDKLNPSIALAAALATQTFAVWSTGTHTAAPVVIGSLGPAAYTDRLKGVIQNTDIAPVMEAALKNNVDVVLVIGDGLGAMHLSLPLYLAVARRDSAETYFEKILREGRAGLCLTNAWDMLVTCSAAGATAISSGNKTRLSMLGVSPDGRPVESILRRAEAMGKSTGLLTDTRLTHATPAAFYAHKTSRSDEAAIASMLALDSVEVLMGGGACVFIPESTKVSDHPLLKGLRAGALCKSLRKDRQDLLSGMVRKGYSAAVTREDLQTMASREKILGLFAGDAMNTAIDRDDENTGEPGLPEMADAALKSLSMSKKGFFLMAECGQIDWNAHAHDAGALLKSVEEMDRVLGVCWRFYRARPEKTLIIFTADHETGGFGIAYGYLNPPDSACLLPGGTWRINYSGLPFAELLKYAKQDKSLSAMIAGADSPSGLMDEVKAHTAWRLSRPDARLVMRLKKRETE